VAVNAPAVLVEPQQRLGFEELYSAHQPRVYRTCLAILRNHDDAAEATQEVFSRVLPLLTQLREPHVWLTTVARNYCFDQLRRQKVRGAGVQLDEETPGPSRDDPERETLLRDALRQAFEALSHRERRALARVLLMDDSLADIASMLGVSYGAAAQVVSRARRRAALAARAVIGASFGWLARLTLPQQRDRAARLAAQAVESGQHVLLAAAFVLTAGGLTHAQAVAPASLGGPSVVPINPSAAHRAAADELAGEAHTPPPSLRSAALGAPSALPPGYSALSVGHAAAGSDLRPGNPYDPTQPGPQQPPVANLQVTPVYSMSSGCAGATVAAGPGNDHPVDQSAVACPPKPSH
jgi:RNA polymerase sigma-70 factor (ECF subfamily)